MHGQPYMIAVDINRLVGILVDDPGAALQMPIPSRVLSRNHRFLHASQLFVERIKLELLRRGLSKNQAV